MFETLKNAFRIKEVRIKIWITLGLLFLYRLGSFVPVPGLDPEALSSAIAGTGGGVTILGLLSAITGGALQYGTIFALGITPYINASIIMQLLTIAIPVLERMSKEGEEGRKKIATITRFVTVALALVQAIGILIGVGGLVDTAVLPNAQWLLYGFIILVLLAGSMLAMWIGERITEYGVGNGVSLLIFVGIISTAGNALLNAVGGFVLGTTDSAMQQTYFWQIIAFLVMVIVVFFAIVFVELAERRIPVQYAKQVKGRKMYGGQSTFIPMRVNASGVMPLIFAFAIIQLPYLIGSMINSNGGFVLWWQQWMTQGWLYSVILALLIVFFAFFYAQIQFNPEDVSRNIQSHGGFIPGIRPGRPTTLYLGKVNNRITLFGAIFLAIISLVPNLLFALVGNDIGLTSAFSTTGLLIVVSVAIEFQRSLDNLVMMKHYKGFLD